MDVSIDSAEELEGLTETQLRAKYDAGSRGHAGVPGAGNREDYSDMIAKEMAKKHRIEKEKVARWKEKEYKF